MKPEGRLAVAIGHASAQGARPDNQDFVGVYEGTDGERARMGLVAALADGVGGHKGGRIAAELAVRALVEGYYEQPDTIGPAAAVARVMAPFNRWLVAMGRGNDMAHAATTFTALVLKGRQGHVAHVGDSRAWHFRDGRLTMLTDDHVRSRPDERHILYRALGIEDDLRLDHHMIDLAVHDRLLLTSDGVHGALSAKRLVRLLGARNAAQADADAIVAAALASGSRDNASAILIDVTALPAADHDGIAGDLAALAIPPPPREGENVDGFRLDTLLSDGRYTRLFRAVDTINGQTVVVKFPKPALLGESDARLAFAREMLIGARVASPFVAGTIAVPPDRRSRLYGVQPFYTGETLEVRLRRPVAIADGARVATMLVRAVAALHRLDIIHRDIKPENIILTEDGGLRLIDLGVARLPRVGDFTSDVVPGTPGYLAPEMFDGNAGDAATDQFALGVTLWRLFAGIWPYGEGEAFSRPRFRTPAPPSSKRPDIPAWLDHVLSRAVAIDPADRFGDVVELLRALEGGAAIARIETRFVPLVERDPVRFWQILSLLLGLALIISLART